MFKALPGCLLLAVFLQAESCFDFFENSLKTIDGRGAYAVASNCWMRFGCPPGRLVLKEDPFTGLCLFEAPSGRPFILSSEYYASSYTRSSKGTQFIELVVPQSGLVPAELSVKSKKFDAIFGGCCQLVALTDGCGRAYTAGFLEKWLQRGQPAYGDFGVRWGMDENAGHVETVDPFVHQCPLMKGDHVVSLDGRRIGGQEMLRDLEIFCEVGRLYNFGIMRDRQSVDVQVKCNQRFGGGNVSDTFLERFGVRFDPNLKVRKLEEHSVMQNLGIMKGDLLEMINGRSVHSWRQIRKCLAQEVRPGAMLSMLWNRRGLQFFMRLKVTDMRKVTSGAE